jgi:hypothetical protein
MILEETTNTPKAWSRRAERELDGASVDRDARELEIAPAELRHREIGAPTAVGASDLELDRHFAAE